MTGPTFLVIPPPDRFVPRILNVGDVVGEDPEFGTSWNIGSPMGFLQPLRRVSVYVATNGKNGTCQPRIGTSKAVKDLAERLGWLEWAGGRCHLGDVPTSVLA